MLSNDEAELISLIIKHIVEITEEDGDGIFVANYENLMLRFPKYDWETLKELAKKL